LRQLKITQQITVRESKSITSYFNDISKLELIDASEESDLAVRIQQGDRVALERLVNGNLRFVVSVAKQYQNKGMLLEDLISEGNAGLIKAAEKFDHTKGFKFISYAVWWIRQSIMAALTDTAKSIRVPSNQIQLQRKISSAVLKFMQENERMPTSEEVAKQIDEPEHKVSFLLSNNFSGQSGDAMLSEDTKSTLFDLMPSNDKTDNNLIIESLSKDIEEVLNKLEYRESYIIRHLFGIGIDRPHSKLEISEDLDISFERIRQIKEKALRRIKANGWNKILLDYV
tara:strand:- start:476 stop:1330 length:855 start_codon:yes stop_codon:yes gene_type:complete